MNDVVMLVVIVLCRLKLPTKITKAAVKGSSSLPQGAKSLLPPRATMDYLEKYRKKKKLDPTGSSIISKSTLSNVNPPLQFCGSCLAKPASYLPLGSTHLSKPVGPGQTKKSVNKLKCVNTVGLGSVNPLSRANQPKRYTGRVCGTQPRSRTETFTKTITKTENNLPSITPISEVSRSYLVPPRNKMKAHAIADVSDALTSLSPPILDLPPVTVATTCSKARWVRYSWHSVW